MKLTLMLAEPTPPADIRIVEDMIALAYQMTSVEVTDIYTRDETKKKTGKSQTAPPEKAGTVFLGKRTKAAAVPIGGLTLESGTATVLGEVCAVAGRQIEKSGAWILDFDITDYTGTIKVTKFSQKREESAQKLVSAVRKIKKGMWLTVSGDLILSRKDGDLVLEPKNIVTEERETRTDRAEEKRVELHLHTKMSAMDAVTDVKEAIRRAELWGHPAIAITDHGVVHSFPEAVETASELAGKIKVIYGVEGYFFNDEGYNTAVFGETGTEDDEFIVFDVETTGLSPIDNRIFEIGAVRIKNGKELAVFHTFIDPEAPIPPDILKLTGRSETDVTGAPSQEDAVKAFLDFAGDRFLVAHNAGFDAGFIYEACQRLDITYTPRYIDTLAMARGLLPELKNHKLNTVAEQLGYSDFKHHQADKDAEATAFIFNAMLRQLEKEGIKSIGHINGYLAENYAKKPKKGRFGYNHIILLAKNETGLHNLYKLVSKSHLEDYDRYPVIHKSLLSRYREGLIVGSACADGEVFEALTNNAGTLELKRIAEFYDYLEIQPVCNNMFMLFSKKPVAKSVEDLREFNRRIIQLGKELNKPVAATGDVHFLDPEDEIFRHILLTAKGFDNADDELPVYFKTTDEMLEEFNYLGEDTAYDVVVRNPVKIAGMCESISPLPPPKKLFLPEIEESAQELTKLVYDNLLEVYGADPPGIVAKRVETEMNDILARGYDVIYMAAQKLVADAWKHGYRVGSRGSVGSSLAAFLAGITEVNALPAHYRCPNCKKCDFESGTGWGCGVDMPDKRCPACGSEYVKDGFNIPFETFLGFDGDKVPDIDLNFSGEYQTQAHKYVSDLFGAEHVFRAGTIATVAEKTAYGYVKKYLESTGRKVTKAEENRLSQGCSGVKRTTGQHPGGVIVIPRDMEITDFCPVQHPADSGDKGIITTHFDYHCMEDNLLKLDALGHDNPTMIKMLEEMTGIDTTKINLGDPAVLAIFSSPVSIGLPENDEIIGATGTIGIPEFGTAFTRQMLNDTKPDKFDTLIRLSGFSHGTDVWLGNAKDLILSGKATVSETIGCRDDIMIFLISKGMDDRYAFKISENVRKGRGLPDGAEENMIDAGVPEWYIESCKKTKYLFPKAHAVAYVLEAVRIAWFKVYRPIEFYSAFFYRRSQKKSFDAEYMIGGIERVRAKIKETRNNPDARQKDEDILPTLEACYEFYLRGFGFERIDLYESDPFKFLVTGENKLRPPFVAISGFGEAGARDLAEKRSGCEFISIDEISAVCPKVSKAHLEQMKALGALRSLPESSQMTLF